MAGWFEVGSSDGGTTHAVLATAGLSRRAGIDTHIVLLHHAHHTWRVWRRCFADALPWAAVRLGLAGNTYGPTVPARVHSRVTADVAIHRTVSPHGVQ